MEEIKPITEDYEVFFNKNPQSLAALESIVLYRLLKKSEAKIKELEEK